ncbi:MAG: hypothetical protein ACHQQQ_14215 [Bacteroidota bacterium]
MTTNELFSVSTAFERCNLMFDLWVNHKDELPAKYPQLHGHETTDDILVQPASCYLILGVALLHTVLEYSVKNKKYEIPPEIRSEVDELYPLTNEFRNCVFHVQDEVLSPRQIKLMNVPDSLARLAKIRQSLEYFLIEELKKVSAPQ